VDDAPAVSAPDAGDAGPSSASRPIALIEADAGLMPMKLAQDDAYLYFSEANTGGVYRIAKAGGVPLPYWEGITFPYAVAVDDTTVYWGDVYGVWRCPKAGCPGGTETRIAPSVDNIDAIAIDSTNVYWTDNAASQVRSAPLTQDTPGTVLWAGTTDNGPLEIATDGQRVFFTSDDGLLHVVQVDGGAVTPPSVGSANDAGSIGVAVQGQLVFWTSGGSDGTVLERPAETNSVDAAVVAGGQELPGAVTSDGVSLFWLAYDGDAGVLRTCTITTCQPSTLAGALAGPLDVVVDSTAVYFSDEQSGVLWKLPKSP
jgi:hypothetical protein